MYIRDTIAAISTPPGNGGIGIIRVSGDMSVSIAELVFIPAASGGLTSHRFYFGRIIDKNSNEILDEAMAVLMKAPRSYTCEDVLELHCHGGTVVVERVLALVLKSGARLAEPGEFTKRAFLNGRIDLIQAESIMDVIEAKTDAALRLAQQQREGLLSLKIKQAVEKIRISLALVEAYIDFPEDDPGVTDLGVIYDSLNQAKAILAQLVHSYDEGHIVRDGISALIVGKPNAGKSSLLNALLKSERSIVTHIPGTTRDIIEESVNIDGLVVKFLDTAGIRHTDDLVEKEGITRALAKIPLADIVISVLDSSRSYNDEDRMISAALIGVPVIHVLNKCDLPFVIDLPPTFNKETLLHIDAHSGSGVDELAGTVRRTFLHSSGTDDRDVVAITRARHRDAIVAAASIIQRLIDSKNTLLMPELLAVELRDILSILGCISGETTTDDLLDIIFSSFCIGK
ncbi:MAG: tRNA uridine-5-carboxymethylaminomethyl(34) synthesis GTPase MnmE [Geobacteraceae bacterium GWC2_48_7]|nr:MAG: tRNA uridine-5-carboxymethylaminomethyl(34) synthesis GTPase MnmE [Geobacteraceae bacterium GWC2_48_7]